jgi:hypothetical membrane protein
VTRRAGVLIAAGICGVAGPLIFAGLIFVLGALYPGYSHVSQTVSVIGAADAPQKVKVVMNTIGFPLLGLTVLVFAAGIECGFKGKRAARAGSSLLAASGVAIMMIGIFNADPGDIDVSWRGMTHTAFTVISSVTFGIAPAFIGLALSSDVKWKAYAAYSYATAIVTLVLALVSILDIADARVGLFQRISIGIPMLWMVVTSFELLSESRTYRAAPGSALQAQGKS